MTTKIKLGVTYKDVVTGFQGIAVESSSYISGCDQILLRPPCGKDGKMLEGVWFDDLRLERVAGAPVIKLPGDATPPKPKTGGPHSTAHQAPKSRH